MKKSKKHAQRNTNQSLALWRALTAVVTALVVVGTAQWSPALAASAGPNSGSTFASATFSGADVSWSSTGNAVSSDNSYASAAPNNNQQSQYLEATGFGFSVPMGSVIDGIEATVERKASQSGEISDYRVRLIKDGTVSSADDKAAGGEWGTADTTATYGDATDLWSASWTAADVNDPDFGLAFAVEHDSGGGPDTAYVDYISLTVYYTAPTAIPFTETFGTSNSGSVTGWVENGSASITGTSGGQEFTQDGTSTNKFAKIDNGDSICRAFDATAAAAVTLSYAWRGDQDAESSDLGTAEYKLAGDCADTAGWTTAASHTMDTNTWTSQSALDLSDDLAGSTFVLRFKNNANSGNENFRVDDITLGTTAPNTAPTITSSAPTTATEDELYTYDADATDPDGPSETWTVTDDDTCGGSIDGDGVYTFTPAGPNPPSSCVLGIQVNDNGTPDLFDTEIVELSLTSVNDAPTITSSAPTTATEDELYTYDADATDPDGPSQTWTVTDDDTCGGSIDGDGVYTFTPAGPVPPVSCDLGIQVSDGGVPNLFDTEIVELSLTSINDSPTANDDAYSTDEDTPLSVSAEDGLLGNDTDPEDDPLTVSLEDDVTNGTLELNSDGSFDYTPDEDFNGFDSFTYTVNDGEADSDPATVTILVDSVNDVPMAAADDYSVDEDDSLTVDPSGVLGNDSDVDGDSLTATLVDEPVNGTVDLNADGSFTYTPDADFNGADSFTYKANDGAADSGEAIVSLTVNPVNDTPTANGQTVYTRVNTSRTITLTGSDIDLPADDLSFDVATDPANGTLSAGEGDDLVYTPDTGYSGLDSFTVTANDNTGEENAESAPATIDVVVMAPPTADPAAGLYFVSTDQVISLSADDSADSIIYTTNGSDPSCGEDGNGTLYSDPIVFSTDTTIKAVACYNDGAESSAITTFDYQIIILRRNIPTGGGGGVVLGETIGQEGNSQGSEETPGANEEQPQPEEQQPTEQPQEQPQPQVLGEEIFADGTLLRGSNHRIYLTLNGEKYYVPSWRDLSALFSGWPITDVDQATVDGIPSADGAATDTYHLGDLVRSSDHQIYAIVAGGLHWVETLAELAANYAGLPIHTVSSDMMTFLMWFFSL